MPSIEQSGEKEASPLIKTESELMESIRLQVDFYNLLRRKDEATASSLFEAARTAGYEVVFRKI